MTTMMLSKTQVRDCLSRVMQYSHPPNIFVYKSRVDVILG